MGAMIFGMIACLLIGFCAGVVFSLRKSDGELIIDEQYDNKVTWFMNLTKDEEKIPMMKRLIFTVRKAN